MSVVDPSLLSSDERPITLRRRADLVVQESLFQSEKSWIIKDPLALKYCRLREPEFAVFESLDGRQSLKDVHARLLDRFPDRLTRIVDIQNLISSLHRQGLLIGSGDGQAVPLLERAAKLRRQKLLQLASSALAMRFPGIDPERLLSWLYPKIRWFFTRWCLLLCLLVVVSALLLVASQWREFYARLPDFYSFFGIQNLISMALILVATKSLHELGHGLVCKHFGGECHEIGFMLLVLTPAMYCDTTDSWILRNKWHRMAIGAAGMYVEVVLAAICTFIWWYTHPGWLHFLALNIMFLCSVSTILFNANPLLRYDGYYILADWLEVPNLSQKSRSALLSKLRVWCLGMEPIPPRFLPEQKQALFAIYSVASVCYRWFILIAILWFLSKVFEPWGLQVIGQALIALSLVGLVGIPIWKLVKFFTFPGRTRQVKRPRLIMTSLLFSAVLLVIFFLPIDYHVRAPLVVQPAEAQAVRVQLDGVLVDCLVKPGDQVSAGQELARLENGPETLLRQRLDGEVFRLTMEIQSLERLADQSLTDITNKRMELMQAERQLDDQDQKLQMLVLRAERDGVVIPPPNVEAVPADGITLPRWSGSPMDPENRYAYLQPNTLFCTVGDPQRAEAKLLIDQSDINLVHAGDPVQIMLEEFPGKRVLGTLEKKSQDKVASPPRELSDSLPAKPQADGSDKPLFDYFEATVPLHDPDIVMVQGFKGHAKVNVGKYTIAWRISRFIKTVLNFS